MTKRHFLLASLLTFLLAWRAEAQFTPQGFSYQCIVRDATGASLNNQTVTLLFTIRNTSPDGPIAYTERQTTSTNAFGLVNLFIGQGTPLQGTFSSIDWSAEAKFLTVSVEIMPNVFDELGSTQLMSVPYALYAQKSANGNDNWGNQTVVTKPDLGGGGTSGSPLSIAQQGASTGQVLKWNGAAWAPQNDATGTGTVTEIQTGAGLEGGPITGSGTISLAPSPVVPGVYGSSTQIPVITVDQHGRITDVTLVPPPPPTIGITGASGINVQQNGLNFVITNTGDTDPADDITTSSQADGDVSGPFSNLQLKANVVGSPEISDNAVGNSEIANNAVTTTKILDGAVTNPKLADGAVTNSKLADGAVTAVKIDNMGAASGQVLKWTGAMWAPAADVVGVTNLSAGQGININGTAPNFTITNTGDTNAGDDITTASQADGDVSGPFSNLQIKANAVTPFEIANNAVTNTKINAGAVTGDKIAQMSATAGQVLKWDGVSWVPAVDNTGSVTINGGIGIDIIGSNNNFTVANSGDVNPFDDITENSTAGGDISGTFDNLQIKQNVVTNFEMANNAIATANLQNGAVTGAKINQMSALNGQVLKWNGSAWAPANDNAGSGGDNWGTQVAITGPTLSGAGIVNAPLELAQQGALAGQVLKWTGTAWLPANDAGDNWGTQTAITNLTLAGNGTGGDPLRIAQQGAGNGQVLKWNGTLWAPADDNNSGGDDWGTQTAVTNPTIAGNGTGGDPLRIAQQGASNGQVLKWNGTLWAPANDNAGSGGDNWGTQVALTGPTLFGSGIPGDELGIAQQGATNGQVLKWNGTLWAPAADNNSGPDNWGTQVVLTGPTLFGTGVAGNELGIAQQGAANGQVLKWNGALWAPANDGGDDWGTQTAVTNPTIAGNGTAGDPLRMAQQGATNGQVLKWNGALWVPAADNNSGPDDWGAQTAVTNATIAGNGTVGNALGIAQQGASNGQVLKWNGSTWLPANDDTGTGPADNWGTQVAVTDATLDGDGTAGNPLGIAQQGATNGQVLKWNGATWAPGTITGDNWGTQVVQTTTEFIGSGTVGDPIELASQGASFGQVLKWQGTFWAPGDDENTGDNWGVQSVEAGPAFSGNGTLLSPLNLAAQGATNGQVLKWNGSAWVPGNDLGGGNNYSAGTGISITGVIPNLTINNTGDLSNTNELQTLSLVGNNLTLSNGGGTVNLPPSNTYSAGTGINVTGSAPNFTIINTGDADANPTNEIQTLSIAGNNLTLSNGGGTVALPSGGNNYSAGTGISITGTAPNLTINNTGDADANPTNELQNLSLNGTVLKITGTNSTVHLDTILTNAGIGLWTGVGAHIHNANSGNVGVGTTTPAVKLHVKGNGEAVRVEGTNPMIGLANGGGAADAWMSLSPGRLLVATQDSSSIILATNNNKSLIIDGVTGNVGVGGPNSNDARFKVIHATGNGGLMIENGDAGNNWDFQVNAATGSLMLFNSSSGGFPAGIFATNGLYTPSDRRLKKDIGALSGVLQKMMQLKPVSYRYKTENATSAVSLGFLAQDVQPLFPELVTQNPLKDGNTYLGLNYAGFGVLAVKAIQEQQVQIEGLQKENDALRAQLDTILSRVQRLEQTASTGKE